MFRTKFFALHNLSGAVNVDIFRFGTFAEATDSVHVSFNDRLRFTQFIGMEEGAVGGCNGSFVLPPRPLTHLQLS